MRSRWYQLVAAVAAVVLVPVAASACGVGQCCYTACYAYHCYKVQYVEKTAVCYKPVYEKHVREVPVTVYKPRYETVEKEVTCTVYKTYWKEEKRVRYVPVTEWREEKRTRCVLVPVYKEVTYDVKVPVVEWKEEQRERVVAYTEWKEEQRECTYTTCKLVPKVVEREVTYCKPTYQECVDPCTGCCYTVCKPTYYTKKVQCTVYEAVPEVHKKVYTVKVPYCVYKKEPYTVKVAHCSYRIEKRKAKVCEYQRKTEEYVVKVPYCTTKAVEYVCKVPYCKPETYTKKVRYQVCHYDKVQEVRKEYYTTCKLVPYEVKYKVPVCVSCGY